MLERVDGLVVVVRDAGAAAVTFEKLLGAEPGAEGQSEVLQARTIRLGVGESRVTLAEPRGPGPAAEHLERWGEGLLAAVVSARDPAAVEKGLKEQGIAVRREDGRLHVGPVNGLHVVVDGCVRRDPAGPLSFVYEVTSLVSDWRAAAATWASGFGLDAAGFHEIRSEQYGYEGTLTLFDPARLDRIELSQPYDETKAMGRFFVKRGESAYMCFAECEDLDGLRSRLDGAGARYTPSDEGGSLFVHPSSLHGVLFGVSRTNVAWRWSGRPELAG